jgi:hypothetical protein
VDVETLRAIILAELERQNDEMSMGLNIPDDDHAVMIDGWLDLDDLASAIYAAMIGDMPFPISDG